MKTTALALMVVAVVSMSCLSWAYHEGTVTAHVADQNGQPVEGMRVDFSAEFPCALNAFPTAAVYTDSGGDARSPYGCAYGQTTITAVASKNGVSSQSSTVVATGDPIISLSVTAYNLNVTVQDQKGRPYPMISVSVSSDRSGTINGPTGSLGFAGFETLPPDVPLLVTARVSGEENQTSVTLSRDQAIMLTLPAYDVTVRAIRDDGAPLQGAVVNVTGPASYAGMKNTDSSGSASFAQIPPGQVAISLRFGNYNRNANVTVSSDSEIALVMDVNAPVVSNVSYTAPRPATQVNVSAGVQDMGVNASGVASVAMYYSTDGTNWRQVPMSAAGGVYGAAVPPQSNNTNVSVKIEAFDNVGNGANSSETQFAVSETAQGTGAPAGQGRGGGLCGGGFVLLGLALSAMLAWKR